MIFDKKDKFDMTQNFYVEMPNAIENILIKGFNIFKEIIKNFTNYNDILAKLEDYIKTDINSYRYIVSGLLHGILYDKKKSEDYFQYLFVINKDNFEFFLINLISLIEWSHLKLTTETYIQIFLIFDKLIHMNNQKLFDLMIILMRVVFVGVWLNERLDLYKYLLSFLKSKLNWICSSSYTLLSGLVFTKILRLTTEHHFLNDIQIVSAYESTNAALFKQFKGIIADEVYIITKLWSSKREEIIGIGKELIRSLISISKVNIPEVKAIVEDIAKSYETDNTPVYLKMLDSKQPYVGFNPFVQINIPPLMEKMLAFILTDVKRSNYIKYFTWINKKFQITNDLDKSIYVDIARYIITCFNVLSNKKAEYTPRWLILGYLLKNCRNDIFLGEIKQAIFYDWLFFNKERDHILLIEPGALTIFNSVREFPELTMELIEFLEVYSENFDLSNKSRIKDNITDAFKHAEAVQIIPMLRSILKEVRIAEEIKTIYGNLIKFNMEEEGANETGKICLIELDNFVNKIEDNSENNLNNINNQINTMTVQKSNRLRKIHNEFFLPSSLTELIEPITWKNLINFKSKMIFKNVLEEICKTFPFKIKSLNLIDTKSNTHPYCVEVYNNFVIFYLNFFKDELISPLETNNYDVEKIQNNYISFYIIDFLISKYFENNEKDFNLISELVKKIIEHYPNYIVKLLYYFSKKAIILENVNKFSSKKLFSIFLKLCDDKIDTMKKQLKCFFEICADYLDIETINFFIKNCLHIFKSLFFNNKELLMILEKYTNPQVFNIILKDINSY